MEVLAARDPAGGPRPVGRRASGRSASDRSSQGSGRSARPSLWRRFVGRCADDGTIPQLLGEDISKPSGFRHHMHATFDLPNIRFEGLPSDWQGAAHKQFGEPILTLPRADVEGYPARIPAVLVVLRQELLRHDGLRLEGVFRVSANKETQKMYRDQIDTGDFRGSRESDVMCMAALIKEWFRALPQPLLNGLSEDTLLGAAKATSPSDAAAELLAQLDDPCHSIFLWLLDLLADAAEHESSNRMSVKALAIVLAPNLYTVPDEVSPFEMVALMDAAVHSVRMCLEERMRTRSRRSTRPVVSYS